ncbi:GNAT family N-acetyltransferase [Cohnella lubricantis]|uniref:GNAT family N-acetyltransferase n=1 Tax=Cohnella lubricantis TaxID=2163172 RepID=UPI002892F765|nr:GNAT family N-acetyltransferase [Cohnella lubricantis]MBP2119090.1 ribosomal protein S18 acetylase RimI-like enzyme [Cohnella lubricantis]
MKDYGIIRPLLEDRYAAVQAVSGDTPRIQQLLLKTAKWLQSRGSSQWSGLLRGEDSHRTPEAVERGDVFLFKNGEDVAAMVMLLRKPSEWDIELWGEADSDRAVYVHRLAIDRDYAGQRLGGSVLQWVSEGIRFIGKDRIRLDCIASNGALNALYQTMGYTYVGESTNSDGSFSKFEKRLTV